MDKRYQVFVSSTFTDLEVERQHVTWALQRMDCIPAGMELFAASSDDQWTVIKRVIDDCDYYLVILAGRYGSLDKDGIGYTEKEFDYALSQGKHVIAFLHKNPGSLSFDKSEQDPKNRKKLEAFRNKAEKRMVEYWTSPEELAARVSPCLHSLFKLHPAEGWVKARFVESTDEVLRLRKRVAELENQLRETLTMASQKSSVSREGMELLQTAAEDDGNILCVENSAGFFVQAGGRQFVDRNNPRSIATYRALLRKLRDWEYIEQESEQGYSLTSQGFELVDSFVRTSPTADNSQRPDIEISVPPLSSEEIKYLQSAVSSNCQIYGREFADGWRVHAGENEFRQLGDEGMRGRYEGFIRRLYEAECVKEVAIGLYELTDKGKKLAQQS